MSDFTVTEVMPQTSQWRLTCQHQRTVDRSQSGRNHYPTIASDRYQSDSGCRPINSTQSQQTMPRLTAIRSSKTSHSREVKSIVGCHKPDFSQHHKLNWRSRGRSRAACWIKSWIWQTLSAKRFMKLSHAKLRSNNRRNAACRARYDPLLVGEG